MKLNIMGVMFSNNKHNCRYSYLKVNSLPNNAPNSFNLNLVRNFSTKTGVLSPLNGDFNE